MHKDVRRPKHLLPPTQHEMPILVYDKSRPDCRCAPDIGSSNMGQAFAFSVGIVCRERALQKVSVEFVSSKPPMAASCRTLLPRHGDLAITYDLPKNAGGLEPSAYVWVARAGIFETAHEHSSLVGISILREPPEESEGEFYHDARFAETATITLRLNADGASSEWNLTIEGSMEDWDIGREMIRCSLAKADATV